MKIFINIFKMFMNIFITVEYLEYTIKLYFFFFFASWSVIGQYENNWSRTDKLRLNSYLRQNYSILLLM